MSESGAGDRLRDQIDRGRHGDKVSAADPAAVPLGTDAEASGAPTPSMAEKPTRRATEPHGIAAHDPRRKSWQPFGIALIGLLVVAAILMIVY